MADRAPASSLGHVKPGRSTTEFFCTLSVVLLSVAIAVATLWHHGFRASGGSVPITAVAVFSAAVAHAAYVHARSTVKRAATAAVAPRRLAVDAGLSRSEGFILDLTDKATGDGPCANPTFARVCVPVDVLQRAIDDATRKSGSTH